MKNIENIKGVLREIADILAADHKLQRLRLDDTPDLSTPMTEKDYLTARKLIDQKYISRYPVVETGVANATRNTFLALVVNDISFSMSGNQQRASVSVFVTTDISHYLLSTAQDRGLEIVNLVCKDLDGVKIANVGRLEVSTIVSLIFDNSRAGYKITAYTVDQPNERAEI